MVLTCPGHINPSTLTSLLSRSEIIAGGISLCPDSTKRFLRFPSFASKIVDATSGAVVSNPTPRKITLLDRFSFAIFVLSRGE